MDTDMDSSVTWECVAVEMLAAESSKLQALMSDPGTSADAVKFELCRFLDKYDLTLPNGPDKYKKAAEFLMNAVIIGSNGILHRACKAREDFEGCAAEAEDLSEDNNGATDTAVQLSAVQEEAARLRRLLAGKARQLSTQQRRVRQLQSENAAALSELETLRSTGYFDAK
ncbi:hypothetical protein OEZ86_001670 [Tetradesmus obliquus]|nr:hypothetical protein OEZ86_001670 [Tetradesmus obliquus]